MQTALAFAQEQKLLIKGDILGERGIGLNNCTIKITGVKRGIIYHYFNTGEKNTFAVSVSLKEADSLNISITHMGYQTYESTRAAGKETNNIQISARLSVKSNDLKTVEIKSPKTWVHGDTTFYKVDAYKEGDEKKLKDLLVKMPGFEITESGQLLYKRNPVEKVTIDGEELFSDKMELMINNFPIHVLNTVDAVENQSQQKLLQGITGERRVFLNLGVKKDAKLKAAFGDGEIGGGNKSRYSITPVVFSIYGKVKAGFIGNWNSIGNGIDWRQENELKRDAERTTANLLMYNNPLQLINNFENRWYIQNRQWDNRLQINSKLGRKIKVQTELAYIRDTQTQQTVYNSSIYDGNSYQNRIDSNANTYRPATINVREQLTFNLDSAREFKVEANFYLNQSSSTQNSRYLGFGITDAVEKAIANDWGSLSLRTDYTHRVSSNRADSWFLNLNAQQLDQHGKSSSADFASIFDAPDARYAFLSNQINTNTFQMAGGWTQLFKSKKNLITNFGFRAAYSMLRLGNSTELNDRSNTLQPLYPIPFVCGQNYSISTIAGVLTKSFNLFLTKPFDLDSELGIAHVATPDASRSLNFNSMTGKMSIMHKHDLPGSIIGTFQAAFEQSVIPPDRLNENYYPGSLTTFSRSVNIQIPQKKISASYYIGRLWLLRAITSGIGLNWQRNLTNQMFINNYNGVINYVMDSLITNNSQYLTISTNHTVPSLFFNAVFNLDAGLISASQLIQNAGKVVDLPYHMFYLNFSMKKNWNKKYFIRLTSRYSSTSFAFPNEARGSASSRVVYIRNNLFQRWVMNSQMNLMYTLALYNNNLFSPNKATFLLADLEWTYQIKNKPLFISVKADNITNQKNFYNFQNSALVQSFSTIPLIRRSVYASLKYSF